MIVRPFVSLAGLCALLLMFSGACGPELTEPSDRNVTGRWESSDTIRRVPGLTITIVQAADGRVSGHWQGDTTGLASAPCAGGVCMGSGFIEGTHSVLQLFLSIQNIGVFTGQMTSPDSIRGTLARDGDWPMGFAREP